MRVERTQPWMGTLDRQCVVIGSFRKDYARILEICDALLRLRIRVLSPERSQIINPAAEFVLLESDLHRHAKLRIKSIEDSVLRKIRQATFVYLCDPEACIGVSAAFEIGYACTVGVPIIAMKMPIDRVIARYVAFEGLPGADYFSGILKQAEEMLSKPRPAMTSEKVFANLRLSYEAGSQPGTKTVSRAYLHDPDGFVSVATALEIGMAKAQGLTVVADWPPNDPMLSQYILEPEPTPGQFASSRGVRAKQASREVAFKSR